MQPQWSPLIEVMCSSLYMYKIKRERGEGKREEIRGRVCVGMDMRYPVILLTERIIVSINQLLVYTHPLSKTEHRPCTTRER